LYGVDVLPKQWSRQDLLRKRTRLLALLPLVTSDKANKIRDQLAIIDKRIGRPKEFEPSPSLVASAAGVDGVGGLQFQVQSPPGAGRLVKIPFYLTSGDFTQLSFVAPEVGPMVYTAAGPNTVSTTNPVVSFTMPNDTSGRQVASGFIFTTPQISWSKLRVVGIETTQSYAAYGGNDPLRVLTLPAEIDVAAGFGFLGAGYNGVTGEYTDPRNYNRGTIYTLIKNLAVGGGANLLSQEGYIDASYYDVKNAGFAGLRAYPELISPNQATVEVAFAGPPLANVVFSISLVCDIQEDTDYGTYNVGPYDRPAAMLRSDVGTANSDTRS
jgi:hypothetical protein